MNLLVNIDMNIHLQYKRKRNNHYSCNVWDQLNGGISNEKTHFLFIVARSPVVIWRFMGAVFAIIWIWIVLIFSYV